MTNPGMVICPDLSLRSGKSLKQRDRIIEFLQSEKGVLCTVLCGSRDNAEIYCYNLSMLLRSRGIDHLCTNKGGLNNQSHSITVGETEAVFVGSDDDDPKSFY